MANFNSAAARLERLHVLTGGEDPVFILTIERVQVLLPDKTWCIADLVFTDVGLLVAAQIGFDPAALAQQNLAQAGWLAGGPVGAIFGALADDLAQAPDEEAVRKLNQAFDRLAAADRNRPVRERFVGNSQATFLPADEIGQPHVDRAKNLIIPFRDSCLTMPRTQLPKDLPPLGEWRSSAIAKRRSRTGGPIRAGLAGLYEWSLRPAESPPDWVRGTLQALDHGPEDGPSLDLVGTMPNKATRQLIQRLHELGDPAAQNLAAHLDALWRHTAWKSWHAWIGLGILVLLAGAGALWVWLKS